MEKNLFVRLARIVSVIIIVVAVVLVALTMLNSDTLATNLDKQNSILNPFFLTGYIALGLCILLALLFPLINTLLNPKSLVKALIGLVILAGLGYLFYALSRNEFSALQLQDYAITENTSRLIGASIYGTYFIGALAVLAILFAEVSTVFKK